MVDVVDGEAFDSLFEVVEPARPSVSVQGVRGGDRRVDVGFSLGPRVVVPPLLRDLFHQWERRSVSLVSAPSQETGEERTRSPSRTNRLPLGPRG